MMITNKPMYMRKSVLLLMIFVMMLVLSQCKKESFVDSQGESKTVLVKCEIPINNNGKSDFSNLLDNGSINWSAGTEKVYVAITGDNPQLIELTANTTANVSVLTFEATVDEGVITSGEKYQVWYFGNSHVTGKKGYAYNKTDNTISGSISQQSGKLSELGYHHIACGEVTAVANENSDVTLKLVGVLRNKIAIACLDLTDVSALKGTALVGTEYKLEYKESKWDFSVTKKDANEIGINLQGGNSKTSCQYVILFPNETPNTYLRCVKKGIINEIEFETNIQANTLYFESGSETDIMPMPWSPYVDLGLPSGVKWAIGNIGASSPEEAGDYYAWGELTTKDDYSQSNYHIATAPPDISGNINHDVAIKNWGNNWRMPKNEDFQELIDNCKFEELTENGKKCLKVTSNKNSKSILLPAAGYREGTSTINPNYFYYWSSLQADDDSRKAFTLFYDGNANLGSVQYKYFGQTIRPVYQENSQN